MLRKTVGMTGWMCLSYCLMGNHMHLLIETREPNLGDGMHRLHGATRSTSTAATASSGTCSRTGTRP